MSPYNAAAGILPEILMEQLELTYHRERKIGFQRGKKLIKYYTTNKEKIQIMNQKCNDPTFNVKGVPKMPG